MKRVLIIGGYGNFGRFIARFLARENNIQLVIGGRNEERAKTLSAQLSAINTPETATIDINNKLAQSLAAIKPDIVIHTSGPYQEQSYHVAQTCIDQGCHYIDLADARDFVVGIDTLDSAAKEKDVLICSGASSVPCLTSAIVDEYIDEFGTLEKLDYAIATAQKTERGLATMRAVLSYAGKPFKTLTNGEMRNVYGWLGLRGRKYWQLNTRLLGNCDIPDLEIFPKRYPELQSIRFQAGLEVKLIHMSLWAFSSLARFKLFPPLEKLAPVFLKLSNLFDPLGTKNSGFYMQLGGTDKSDTPKEITFDLVAREGDGLYIPAMPAILMAKKLANSTITQAGASPCVGFISLQEYLDGLRELAIEWRTIKSE